MNNEPKTIQLQEIIAVTPLTREERGCQHMRIELIDARRLVHCRDCGIEIDPYDYLRRYAVGMFGHAARMAKNAQEIADRLTGEIEELQRQKRNLKSSVRRLERKNDERG